MARVKRKTTKKKKKKEGGRKVKSKAKKAKKGEAKKTRKTKVKKTSKIPEVTEEELIQEIAKLLSLGVPEKDIINVMKEAGFLDNEIMDLMSAAKEMYLPSATKHEEEVQYYEPNPWLMIITVGFLLGIAIFAILILLKRFQVI